MAKSKKEKKDKGGVSTLSEGDFFVVGEVGTELFLVDYNAQTHTPVWGSDINQAFWSTKVNKVTTFISQQNIQNAEARPKNGEHPSGRPPL